MSRRNRKPPPAAPVRATIESLAHDGRGVAHVNGKATFIDGALPGEEVLFTYLLQRKRFDQGVALVFRHLDPLSAADIDALRAFGHQHDFFIYLQPAGPDSVRPLWPEDARLSYRLAEFDVELEFLPTDFTQVNGAINGAMVQRALDLLDLHANERVLDLFCGIGNFTLPIARRAAVVVGVEGDAKLVARAHDNARARGNANVEFHAADLSDENSAWPWAAQPVDKILLAPPRTGALEAVRRMAALGAQRIVYVSCNPATFARDAADRAGSC